MMTNRRPFRLVAVSATAAAVAMLAGCSSGGRSGSSDAMSMTERDSQSDNLDMVTYATGDAAFIDSMLFLCQLNDFLAQYELSNGVRSEVQEVAEGIRRREAVNLEFLRSERARLGIQTPVQDFLAHPHAADDKRRLEVARGEEVDAFFVEHMIRHRLEVAKLAESHRASLESPNLRYFCRAVADDAGRELRELRSVQMTEREVPANARAGKRGAFSR